jgi:hypothetical protein
MKSKLFNSLLDLLLDIILWIMREKDDHPPVPCPIGQPQPEENRLLGSSRWVHGKGRNQGGGQTT